MGAYLRSTCEQERTRCFPPSPPKIKNPWDESPGDFLFLEDDGWAENIFTSATLF
jgi:hypothetical protein